MAICKCETNNTSDAAACNSPPVEIQAPGRRSFFFGALAVRQKKILILVDHPNAGKYAEPKETLHVFQNRWS